MKNVRFGGSLLVPCKNSGNFSFFWAGDLNCSNACVHVIVFNSDNKDEFKGLLEKDLEVLKEKEQIPNVVRQIEFIDSTLKTMSDPVYVKQPDIMMLEAADRLISSVMKQGVRYTPEQVTYLSWVSSIS